jgi:hypothetical protein
MSEENDKSNQPKKIVQADADLRNEIAKEKDFDPRKKNKAITILGE